jgi:hypothetical protein
MVSTKVAPSDEQDIIQERFKDSGGDVIADDNEQSFFGKLLFKSKRPPLRSKKNVIKDNAMVYSRARRQTHLNKHVI